jgi:hypothetical protein
MPGSQGSKSRDGAVDVIAQIRLFGKLKLAKCARPKGVLGFFETHAEESLFFSLLLAS